MVSVGIIISSEVMPTFYQKVNKQKSPDYRATLAYLCKKRLAQIKLNEVIKLTT